MRREVGRHNGKSRNLDVPRTGDQGRLVKLAREASPVELFSVSDVLSQFRVEARRVEPLQVELEGNSVWRIDVDSEPLILRRYHSRATLDDVLYEHAVLAHVAAAGWTVPVPVTAPLELDGSLYCLTRFVPGAGTLDESADGQVRRGRDLAHLHVCLRELDLAQRPGWRSQHHGVTVWESFDWDAFVAALRFEDEHLGEWAARAVDAATSQLEAIGSEELPVVVVHGDFTSWNVHYLADGTLAGVIDFGLTHVDSRPYELAIARTYRAPLMVDAYCDELVRLDWPLTELEEAARIPLQHAFRVDMTASFIDSGIRSGTFDSAMIRRQLERSGTPPP